MGPRSPTGDIVGREAEQNRTRAWVDLLTQGGEPGPLVFCVRPGMGKTTLWWHALDGATSSGGHVLSTRPSEADLALGFGGLADLLTPSADVWMSHMPPHLVDALASALMLVSPTADYDRLAVLRGAQLALEAVAATAGCLAIGIDDVQWLDPASAQAISYTLRRWSGPPIGLVVTWRDGTDEPLGLASLPGTEWSIEVGPLSAGDIRRLVASGVPTGVSGRHRSSVESSPRQGCAES